MSISLKKGEKISLTKDNAGLKRIVVGLGWDEAKEPERGILDILFKSPRTYTSTIDCDASAIVLRNGKFTSEKDLVYFRNLHHYSGAINHRGDNLTGQGDGDDEQIVIDLTKVPDDCDRIVIVANIYRGQEKHQHFGMINNAFIRVFDDDKDIEICKYNLTDNYSDMTAIIFGEVYKHDNEWRFNAIGQGTKDKDLAEIGKRFK